MFVTRKLQALKATQLSQGYKAFSALAGLDAKTPKEKLTFGSTFSDHLLEVDWDKTSGWGAPLIRPYGPLAIDPAASSLHYALQVNLTSYRHDLTKLKLILLDQSWIPQGDGYSLYIRPTGVSTHAGTMNLFVYWINEQGEKELITAPLTRGDILPGVTRQSILELARGWGEFKVTETTITMPSIVKAEQEGRLLEVFGSGTAAVISPVKLINYNGKPRVESYTIYPSEFEEVDVLLTRWYAHHGIGRLNVLLQCMERMRLVVFVHAVLYGRQDVLDIIHDRLQFVHLDQNAEACGKPKLVYKWKDSFVLAAHHGHVQSLQYLHKNHFKRTSDTSVWFVAAANGHVGILKYLHDHDVEGWRHSIMEEAIKHGQLEVVRWIYDNKSDMQSLAVVNQALGVALEHRQLGVAKYLNQLWHAKMHR
ncbi:hypothetical protein DYB35_005332 [Aphanomyces astaci]|uniref:Uncharacterized protein n=1 Tax=Aphanomyces astaci TaxID=112090 RepID=A0A418CQC3_APHAT|nr:hypothetical protein DYB35_005332 [Aphanomyces astaci]